MAGTSRGGGGAGHEDDTYGDGARGDSEDPRIEDAEVEARWADIVAQLAELDDDAQTGDAPTTPTAADPSAPQSSPGHVVARTEGPRDWPATPDVEALEEAEYHFTPPDPGPVLTSRDPLATLAWAGAVGIPLLAVAALIVRSFLTTLLIPSWIGPTAVLLFLAAVAVLVWRMPQRRDPSDHDDGAVV